MKLAEQLNTTATAVKKTKDTYRIEIEYLEIINQAQSCAAVGEFSLNRTTIHAKTRARLVDDGFTISEVTGVDYPYYTVSWDDGMGEKD